MIVKTSLADILGELTPHLEKACLKGQGTSSFVYAVNKGRAVEISEDNGGYWLEFWEKSEDEDAPPVKELTVGRRGRGAECDSVVAVISAPEQQVRADRCRPSWICKLLSRCGRHRRLNPSRSAAGDVDAKEAGVDHGLSGRPPPTRGVR